MNEKHVIHNTAKGVPRNEVIGGEKMSEKNNEIYMCVLEVERKGDAVI